MARRRDPLWPKLDRPGISAPRAPRWERRVMRATFGVGRREYIVEIDGVGNVTVRHLDSGRVAFRGTWRKHHGIEYMTIHDIDDDWYKGLVKAERRDYANVYADGVYSLQQVRRAASEAIHRTALSQPVSLRKNPAHRHRCACRRRAR